MNVLDNTETYKTITRMDSLLSYVREKLKADFYEYTDIQHNFIFLIQ